MRALRPIWLLLPAAACTDLAAPETLAPRWNGDVAELVSGCLDCHGAGGVEPRLDTYGGAIDCRADGTPWAAAGDDASPILRALERPDHAAMLTDEQVERLRTWVVESGLTFWSPLAHGPGFAAPSGGLAFHGTILARAQYAPALAAATEEGACAGCHGAPVEKGGAIACTSCHSAEIAVDTCDGCHGGGGDPLPRLGACDQGARRAGIGAHALHAAESASPYFPGVPCSTCHVIPADALAAGHLDGPSPGRADVRFDAAADPRLATATYDRDNRSCSVSACHATARPAWTDTATVASCDSCHGDPPAGHASARCTLCHTGALDGAGKPQAAFHLDGLVQVGRECTDCHGSPTAPSFDGDPGAHSLHLLPGRFAEAMPCESCHLVPSEVIETGHIDSDLPADVVLLTDRGTTSGRVLPRWNAAARSCADVGCHGGALDGGDLGSLPWSASSSTAMDCGSCHGLPPLTVRGGEAFHLATGDADCGACHKTDTRAPITDGPRMISAAGKSAHIDGCVQLEAGCP